jgi:hypothetical protein
VNGLEQAFAADDTTRGFAGQGGDDPIELADAGFAGVILNDVFEGGVGDANQFGFEAVFIQLPRQEKALGDLKFSDAV